VTAYGLYSEAFAFDHPISSGIQALHDKEVMMNKRSYTKKELQRVILVIIVVVGLLTITSLVFFFSGEATALFKAINPWNKEHEGYLAALPTQLQEVTGAPVQTAISKRIESESQFATKAGYEMESLTSTPMSIRTLFFSTPVPTGAVTPEIFDCFAFRRIHGFSEINCWHGYNEGQHLIVIMMQEQQNPSQSWLYMEFANQTEPLWLRIPNLETNPVKIIKMDGFLLTLQADNSRNLYFFDTLARQFVDSARNVLPTATPAPTIVITSPPPTPTEILPYP
jgi:hypothetical protein